MKNLSFESFCNQYNYNTLNDQQKAAIQAIDGPILLLAVPGSGKTTVLIARVGYMIQNGIAPESILSLTYTKAAAKEMGDRFQAKFPKLPVPRFSTIHSFCVKVIRVTQQLINISVPELKADSDSVIRNILWHRNGEYPTEALVRGFSACITQIKNARMTDDEIIRMDQIEGCACFPIYKAYLKEMEENNWMDFDDQLIYAYSFLQNYPEVLKVFQEQYKYVCIDEAQDTSLLQHNIIALVAQKYQNLFMVGDDDQSIYGFRAACPQILLDFKKNYPNALILSMETNYRSCQKIVTAANAFIKKNKHRYRKNMVAYNNTEGIVRVASFTNTQKQYIKLMELIRNELAANTGDTLAILYRNNESALPLLHILLMNGISNISFRDDFTTFFSCATVNDIMTWIQFLQNPSDENLFRKLYYKFGLFISSFMAATAIEQQKYENTNDLIDTLYRNSLYKCSQYTANHFVKHFEKARNEAPAEAIRSILFNLNLSTYIKYKYENSAGAELSKIATLISIAEHYKTFSEFEKALKKLQELKPQQSNVVLSTMHSAKGLEYSHVIIIDATDDVFILDPINSPDAYEEELRLFYVATTRAKSILEFYVCKENSMKSLTACRFIDSFMKGVLPVKKSAVKINSTFAGTSAKKLSADISGMKSDIDISAYAAGQMIKHKTFGEGMLIDVKSNGVATISFEGHNTKMLDLKTCISSNILELI